eukprot:8657610-Pyramimonas_sp.AAC.1
MSVLVPYLLFPFRHLELCFGEWRRSVRFTPSPGVDCRPANGGLSAGNIRVSYVKYSMEYSIRRVLNGILVSTVDR